MSKSKKEMKSRRRKTAMRRKAEMHEMERKEREWMVQWQATHADYIPGRLTNFHRPKTRDAARELIQPKRWMEAQQQQVCDFSYEEEPTVQLLECMEVVRDFYDQCIVCDGDAEVHLMSWKPRKRYVLGVGLCNPQMNPYAPWTIVAVNIPVVTADEDEPIIKKVTKRIRPGGRVERTMKDPNFFVKKEPEPYYHGYHGFFDEPWRFFESGVDEDGHIWLSNFPSCRLQPLDEPDEQHMEAILRMKGDI